MLLNGIRLTGYSSTDDAAQFELAETTVKEVAALDGQLLTVTEDDGTEVEAFVGYSVDYIKREGGTVRMRAVKVMDDATSAAIEALTQKVQAADAKAEDAAEKAEQAATGSNPQVATFARMALAPMAKDLTDAQAASVSTLWPEWSAGGVSYKVKDVVSYRGELYRCSQAHTSQADWSPSAYAAGWAHIAIAPDGLLIWTADAIESDPGIYNTGVKVHHPDAAGPVYTSKRDGNTSVPGEDEWWVLDGEEE